MRRNPKNEPIPFAQPRDPNGCFVLFPVHSKTAGSVVVSLQSLLNQVQKQPATRRVECIQYDPQTYRMDIRFE